VVVDGRVAFVGGLNLTDEEDPRVRPDAYRDLHLRVQGDVVRKLQDLFVDRKVPRGERDRIPIVTTADDRIVWVAGHVLDPDFRVIDPAQAVVVLRLKGVGGSC